MLTTNTHYGIIYYVVKEVKKKMKRKEKNYIKIGSVDFELQKDELKYTEVLRKDYNDIFNCYQKCSGKKYEVFTYYYNLLDSGSDEILQYGINSYNCNIITLHSIINIDYQKYYIYITPTKNLIWKVCGDI